MLILQICQYWYQGVSNRAKRRPRFQDLKISLRSQDFCGISRFHRDFKISHRFQDLTEISQDLTEISQDLTQVSNFKISRFHKDFRSHIDFKISLRFCKISLGSLARSLNFTEVIGKILLGISDLGFQARFQLGFQHLHPRFHPVVDPLIGTNNNTDITIDAPPHST